MEAFARSVELTTIQKGERLTRPPLRKYLFRLKITGENPQRPKLAIELLQP